MRWAVKPQEEWGRSFSLPRLHSSRSFVARFLVFAKILSLLTWLFNIFIRLWEAGWKGRYYKNKFELSEDDEGYDDFRKKVVRYIYILLFCINISVFQSVTQAYTRENKIGVLPTRVEPKTFRSLARMLCH